MFNFIAIWFLATTFYALDVYGTNNELCVSSTKIPSSHKSANSL
jgi:hypothetical protein